MQSADAAAVDDKAPNVESSLFESRFVGGEFELLACIADEWDLYWVG